MAISPIILAHIVTAGGALALGGATLMLRKGTPLHKLFGRLWVVLMLVTALISFGIRRDGDFSPIHILSVITLVGVTASVAAARYGRIRAHRRGMLAAYLGLVIAGIFTLLPGRLLGDLLWNTVAAI